MSTKPKLRCRWFGHDYEPIALDFDTVNPPPPLIPNEWSFPDVPIYPGKITEECQRCGHTYTGTMRVTLGVPYDPFV